MGGSVRGRQPNQDDRRPRAVAWACLLRVAGAMATATGAWAPGVAVAEALAASAATSSASVEPVDLSAHRVQVWESGPIRWVVLEGEAAVLQGVDGVRAERAVVQIIATGPESHRLEVFAEGNAQRTGEPRRRLLRRSQPERLRVHTASGVRLKPYTAEGLVHLDGWPTAHQALLARAFPDVVEVPEPPAGPHPARDPPAPEVVGDPARPEPPRVALGAPEPLRDEDPGLPPLDSEVRPSQFEGMPIEDLPPTPVFEPVPGLTEPDPILGPPELEVDLPEIPDLGPLPDLEPLPPSDAPLIPRPARPPERPPGEPIRPEGELPAPIAPGTQRVVGIYPRDGGPNFQISAPMILADGTRIVVIQGGVTLIAHALGTFGTVDISADRVVLWTREQPGQAPSVLTPSGDLVQDVDQPLEVYLEGNVVFRQDERRVAGSGDQKTIRASWAYYDFRTDRFLADNAELDIYAPGLIAPVRTKGARVQQFRRMMTTPDGQLALSLPEIRADRTAMTGSRFARPGYQFTSRSLDLTRIARPLTEPFSGTTIGDPNDPAAPQDLSWQIDARRNVFYMGPIPIFYWPRFVTEDDEIDPPLRQISFRADRVFGQQLLTDWSGFKLLGLRRPDYIDNWNIDFDYLSQRGFALGSEVGWFGPQLLGGTTGPFYGWLDVWGIRDRGIDIVGTGPAVVTDGPPGAGQAGFQRDAVPFFVPLRGRVQSRNMVSLVGPEADIYDDFRLQLEAGYLSDRRFFEQYYPFPFYTDLDQHTLAYLINQRENRAWSVLVEGNLMDWYTESQWLPRLDYYRLGDSLLGDWFTYYQHTGINWANTHTAVEVANPDLFNFLPYDPISLTSNPLRTGRMYTNHELNLPLNLGFMRVVPYGQGQLIGWDSQYATGLPPLALNPFLDPRLLVRDAQGATIGRAWGAGGARANIMAWRAFPTIRSELLNIHGLNHKINLEADYRTAYSTMPLQRIGIQDDLDDNTYEFVRRYFALTGFANGVLPAQYDPLGVYLRRAISPISGTTDVQDTIDTLRLGLHQRLQTKRGPDGQRRVVDWMILDLTTVYFPRASRDNFGKPFGQNMYNWEWYVGDRTSLLSYGWFEFFDITGQPLQRIEPRRTFDPFGMKVITAGVSIDRPPRANVFIAYSIINTGPIATSALNTIYSYWLSPKWYSTFGTSYDFGNAILLGTSASLTRVGADFLTSIGLAVDPQRQNYTFNLEVAPRLAPNLRLGSGSNLSRFDNRFAPTQ